MKNPKDMSDEELRKWHSASIMICNAQMDDCLEEYNHLMAQPECGRKAMVDAIDIEEIRRTEALMNNQMAHEIDQQEARELYSTPTPIDQLAHRCASMVRLIQLRAPHVILENQLKSIKKSWIEE